MTNQCCVIDIRCIAHGAMAHSIRNNFLGLCRAITQFCQCGRYRLVDDFEITATGQFLKFHQCEIWFDACGVTIHHQTNGARWRNHGNLRVAVTVLFTQRYRFVPRALGQFDQFAIWTVFVIQWNWFHFQTFISGFLTQCCTLVITHHAQHVLCVLFITREWAQLFGHFGRCCV